MIFSSLLSIRSHPVRVRGLKHRYILQRHTIPCVAPRAGAWIETDMSSTFGGGMMSHPVRVRGLKH